MLPLTFSVGVTFDVTVDVAVDVAVAVAVDVTVDVTVEVVVHVTVDVTVDVVFGATVDVIVGAMTTIELHRHVRDNLLGPRLSSLAAVLWGNVDADINHRINQRINQRINHRWRYPCDFCVKSRTIFPSTLSPKRACSSKGLHG